MISFEDGEFSSSEYGILDRILAPFKNLSISANIKSSVFSEKNGQILLNVRETEAGAVSVDENVFLFGGFDHNRVANFGKNTTLGTDFHKILLSTAD